MLRVLDLEAMIPESVRSKILNLKMKMKEIFFRDSYTYSYQINSTFIICYLSVFIVCMSLPAALSW
jgi:hypothetical protein